MNPFLNRKYIIGGIFSLLVLVYIIRLFFLQVIDQTYKTSASNNVLRYITQYPSRGLVYDRTGKLLIYNEAAYDLMVVPKQLVAFDTAMLCKMLNLTKEQVDARLTKAKRYSWYKPSVFEKQISAVTYAPFQEKMHLFKGFFIETRTLRKYPYKSSPHVLGYVGEVDEKIATGDDYYNPGDYIGISGIEKSYETILRGKKGVKIFMVDVHNRIKGSYKDGKFDQQAINGENITLTIDVALQQYGEYLMQNKIGSIVAIEPESGEILAIVSAPAYDPGLLVGRERANNYNYLKSDTLKPLFDRALMARYPPGSTFKTINALIGQQEQIINVSTKYSCYGGYHSGRFFMGCHHHASPLNLVQSIQHSCNAWYANEFRALLDHPKYNGIDNSYQVWRSYIMSFGLGKSLGVDLPHEVNGYIPTLSFYHRIYGEKYLKSLNIVSLSIGQGEILLTPVQLANIAATISNKGYYYTPHVVKKVPDSFENIQMPYLVRRYTNVDSTYFEPVIEGMYLAVHGADGGTARIAKVSGLDICGKTGTAENPHGKDHSIFMCFAPKDNPKIAIAVYVENGGFGASWAAPIASLMVEKYLTGQVNRPWLESYIINANLLDGSEKE